MTTSFDSAASRPPFSTWQLVVADGPAHGLTISLQTLPLMIGRGRECHLQLNDAQASRQHCQIEVQAGRLVVRDLRSRNGTLVNSRRVIGCLELQAGDMLIVGRTALQIRDGNDPLLSLPHDRTTAIPRTTRDETISGTVPRCS